MVNCNKVSVIIPAYNVEPYLEKCVNSVVNQTMENLEIIIVDDGSTDGTSLICDRLKLTDNRINVVHQKNAGLSAARNVGLDIATGEWIAFLDSDDWIEPFAYEVMLKLAIQYDAEIASCMSRNVVLGYNPPIINPPIHNEVFTNTQMISGLLTEQKIRFEVWNKIWKRSLIGDTRFIIGQVSEDIHFDRILFLRANRMVHTNQIFHNYLVDRLGNTMSSFKKARMCVFDEFEALLNDVTGNIELSEIVSCITINFAISMYSEAVLTNQEDSIKKELLSIAKRYYPIVKKSKYRNKKLLRIFFTSPNLYIYLLKIRLGRKIV